MQVMVSNNQTSNNGLRTVYGSVQQFRMNNDNGKRVNLNSVNNGMGSHVTLPPISSFDNLIRAAEKQYGNNNAHVPNEVNIGSSPVLLSYQLTSPQGNSLAQRRLSSTSSVSSTGSNGSNGGVIHAVEASVSPLQMQSPSAGGIVANKVTKSHKPRKKKECPICHNFYANLSTHKSTHLTPEDRPHKCPICSRGFARNNDLIRHKKRHWKDEIFAQSGKDGELHQDNHSGEEEDGVSSAGSIEQGGLNIMTEHDQLKSLHQIKGTFKCPYNSSLIQLDMEVYPYKSKPLNFETSNCHQTGVFSRCDTFKNHLKALHFEYPPGTKKKDRSIVPGRCKHCGLKFQNVDVWLNEHVGKTCGYHYH